MGCSGHAAGVNALDVWLPCIMLVSNDGAFDGSEMLATGDMDHRWVCYFGCSSCSYMGKNPKAPLQQHLEVIALARANCKDEGTTPFHLDSHWLPSDNLSAMATTVQTKTSTTSIRVALVIESGKLKPIWFEQTGRSSADRIFIRQVCSIWNHQEGAAKVINFAVTDGSNSYVLALNTLKFSWELGVVEVG